MSKHTPGPWEVGEFSDFLGYDCMTAGVRAGPVYLDGADYGQKRVHPMTDDQKERMMADAHLIAAAPDLLGALKHMIIQPDEWLCEARVAIARAEGRS